MRVLVKVVFAVAMAVMMSVPCVLAGEVYKGAIPQEHLDRGLKQLPWGVAVWDVDEAIDHLKARDKNILWVDTRPETLFNRGTIRGAVLLPFNKTGEKGNVMTKEKLEKALSAAKLSANSARIVFFCQGPKCHRSYNAAYVCVNNYGFAPENIVWFRDGYPLLKKTVKKSPKLKRKAKRFLSDAGMK